MCQKFTLLLCCCFLGLSLSAQVLTGRSAEKVFSKSTKILLDERTQLPKHIEIAVDASMTLEEAIRGVENNERFQSKVSLQSLRTDEDQLGFSHHRYQQLHEGRPVVGGVYLFHTMRDKVQSINGILYPIEEASPVINISKEEALAIGMAPFPNATFGWEMTHGGGLDLKLAEEPDPELVWVPVGLDFQKADFRLAYKMDIYALDHGHHHRSWIYVDAETGDIIAEENRICEINVPGKGFTAYSDNRDIIMDKVSDTDFRLRQSTYGNGVITLNLQNLERDDVTSAVDFTHEDSIWGLDVPLIDRYALDAHFATEQFYLMINEYFGRTRLNENDGILPMISYVHLGEDTNNAFWDGTATYYGDSDGIVNENGEGFDKPFTTIDIVGHEFAHGLTQFSAGLIYAYEPGALNESFSDIFGLALDFYARPESANWAMGEECTANNLGIRSAENPNFFDHPDTYFGDSWSYGTFDIGGVHLNSGVQNHWFYLLSEGGSGVNDHGETFEVEGIGWEKALAIAYRNLHTYLTPTSHYRDAAYFGNLSAADLFGPCSQEYQSTVNAWYAVGLGEPAENTIGFLSQRVFCNNPASVTFFNEARNYDSVLWDFGDGNTSTEITPTHTYFSQGDFDVSLSVTYCDGTTGFIEKETHIIIDNNDPVCDQITTSETDTTILNTCTGMVLDPGGLGSYEANIFTSVTIIDPPINEPLLLAIEEFNLGGRDILRIYSGDDPDGDPIAQFVRGLGEGQIVEVPSGSAILVLSADEFGANFKDGFVITYSTLENVDGQLPIADFTTTTGSLETTLNAPVSFVNTATLAGVFEWDFGDGTTSTEEAPTHQFTSPGTFTVTQKAINCIGENTRTQTITVTAGGVLQLNPDSICITLNAGVQLDTSFMISNIGTGDLYYGNTETNLNWLAINGNSGQLIPNDNIVIYLSIDTDNLIAGTFNYDLPLESGDLNQLNVALPIKIIVLPFPQNNFDVNNTDFCNGIYQFVDGTLNEPTSWLWDFGDGNTSTEASPEHQYTEEGTYDVSLIACNALGCDSLTQDQLIFVNYCDTLTIGETGSTTLDNCNGVLYDQGGPNSNYSNNADYIVSIQPTGADSIVLFFNSFLVQPSGDELIIYDGADTLAPIIRRLSGSQTGLTISSSGSAITLRFVSNFSGSFAGFEIVWSCGNAIPPTDAAFAFSQNNNCTNTVTLEATPIGNYDYIWDLGDGNTVTTNSNILEYNYQTAGTYAVNLEVSNVAGASFSSEETLTVNDIPFSLDATISADLVELNETFTMEAIVDITPASYLWIPQAGDTLTSATEMYAYAAVGDYVIYLEVTDADGCKMFIEKPITVAEFIATNDLAILNKFEVTPNPSNGQFMLSLDLVERKTTDVILFNTLGQALHQVRLGDVDHVNTDLNFEELPTGIYFLSVMVEGQIVGVQRLVIQK